MELKTIDEIYSYNARFHERLKEAVLGISDEKASAVPEGGQWSISHVVEHIAIVEEGAFRICRKLLTKAESDGALASISGISNRLREKTRESAKTKLEAPEIVRPTGESSVSESLQKLEDNRRRLLGIRPLFEKYDSSTYTFPHPFFGMLNAAEWLMLVGGHGERHLEQIRRIMDGEGK